MQACGRRSAATFARMATLFALAACLTGTSESQVPSGSLAERLKAVQSGQADERGPPVLPAWKAVSPNAVAPAVPLLAGLRVVTAIHDPRGDYESIKTITEVGRTAVRLHYSADKPGAPKLGGLTNKPSDLGMADPALEFPDKVECQRVIDASDLARAHGYSELFCRNPVEQFPGSTSISGSTEILTQLRAGQRVDFHFTTDNMFAVFAQLGAQVTGEKSGQATLTQYAGQPMYSCQLHRVETADLAAPVLLNDQPATLPALHAMCTLDDNEEAHLYFLDQPQNPLVLAFQLGPIDSRLQVIKITLPPPPPPQPGAGGSASSLERALADRKPVEVYGIYFDFNSATIKPESEDVLQQIAAIMRKNPDWTLRVSGYTDNIGNDRANLVLSQRRAAAVKDALVTRFHFAPQRFATNGFGSASPIDTNDTLEGRARNRRVELQRQ
jgi:outer membrane protein OmpA-like peptidoglycan-associated protein